VQRKDAGIRNVFHNKIAYLGNRFPVSVEIFAYNYAGKNAAISIYKDDKLLETQNISLKSAAELKEVNFLLTAEKAGTIPYKIVFQPFEDEFTTVNNTKIIYPEIIDNKEKILLVAAAPHPDIKAIRSAIEKNENYDFEIFIPNVSEKQPDKKYDLMIFMHLPSPNVSATVLRELMKKSRKHCFIIGGNILQTTFNQLNTGLTLSLNPQQSDKVFPEINSAFNRFQLDDEAKKQIADFTPLSVPYGDFSFSAQTEILIYQRVGRIATKKPIFAFSETSEDSKTGFIIGEGFWQWRLQEFAQSDKHHAFDMLWGKFFQFIGNKSDKSRFRVSTGANEYFSGEPVSFQVEIYDEIFEKIVGQKVDLEISGKDFNKKYSFNNSTTDFRYAVEGLAEGLYTFSASTLIDGKTETVKGKFIVKSTQIEAVSVKADFNLLKNLAKKQNGKFYAENETEKLGEDLAALTPLMTAQTTEEFDDILRLPYIFIFLLFLASLEWFLRKYKGGY
jgi:hypothetical protein